MIAGDTIAAISSAVGQAVRMIVRVSGSDARKIAGQLVVGDAEFPSVSFTQIKLDDLKISAWVYLFASPRSYTGEDSAEFHIPGNPLLAKMLLRKLIEAGAREAQPGEFTARAYFNGRMDLSQAEGVAATIAAASDAELHAARRLLSGELANRLRPAMDSLAELLALIEAGIDFSEEDISFISPEALLSRIDQLDAMLDRLIAESARLERLHHTPQFVLVGWPNAGKSTLLNALAGQERAIVSPVAGTTRDVLSADAALPRGIVRLIDVAGLEAEMTNDDSADDSPTGQIAKQMQARALKMIEQADHVILIRDGRDDRPDPLLPRPANLIVSTKSDLQSSKSSGDLHISAQTGSNLDQLRARLDLLAFGAPADQSLAINARHVQCIVEARQAIARARVSAYAAGPEVVALDLREALNSLGEVLGEISPDDVLGRVFATFCIGK